MQSDNFRKTNFRWGEWWCQDKVPDLIWQQLPWSSSTKECHTKLEFADLCSRRKVKGQQDNCQTVWCFLFWFLLPTLDNLYAWQQWISNRNEQRLDIFDWEQHRLSSANLQQQARLKTHDHGCLLPEERPLKKSNIYITHRPLIQVCQL